MGTAVGEIFFRLLSSQKKRDENVNDFSGRGEAFLDDDANAKWITVEAAMLGRWGSYQFEQGGLDLHYLRVTFYLETVH